MGALKVNDVSEVNWFSIVKYDEDSPTGLSWIKIPNGVKKNTKQAGGLCVNRKKPHMARIRYNKIAYPVHRVIWFMFNGPIPEGMVIDHLDGNPWNNNLLNLYLKTPEDNARNVRMNPRNTSGITGVSIMDNGSGNMYAMATWRDENLKPKSKYFSFGKLGEEEAIRQATIFRNERIQELIAKGFNYTERHGT